MTPPVLTAGAVLTSVIGAVLTGPGAVTAKGWVASLELTSPDVVVVGATVRVLTVPEVPETVLEVVWVGPVSVLVVPEVELVVPEVVLVGPGAFKTDPEAEVDDTLVPEGTVELVPINIS
jgi:hypothetical protein